VQVVITYLYTRTQDTTRTLLAVILHSWTPGSLIKSRLDINIFFLAKPSQYVTSHLGWYSIYLPQRDRRL